jgi:hypothetical protein
MDTTPSRALVLSKLNDCFPNAEDASDVLRALDTYGREPWHNEVHRVQLAVLKLCNNDAKRVPPLVEHAGNDFRDALAAAEYPQEFDADFNTPAAELREIRKRDRQQYLDWLISR